MNTQMLSSRIKNIPLLDKVRADSRRRVASDRAFAAFRERFPACEASLFDEHFLRHAGAGVVANFLSRGRARPDDLAEAWAEQFYWRKAARRRSAVRRMVPAAAHYLQLLRAELGPRGHSS